MIKNDRGLTSRTNAGDINEGAEAAMLTNHILVNAIKATGVARDNVISVDDIKAINNYIRTNHLEEWVTLHGDDEGNGEETGFHLVQNDGGKERYRGDKFINTVIDGIYHLGFAIQGDYVLNEDGNRNANLGDLATWLNNFYLMKKIPLVPKAATISAPSMLTTKYGREMATIRSRPTMVMTMWMVELAMTAFMEKTAMTR